MSTLFQPATFHAPPERLPTDEIARQVAELDNLGSLRPLLDLLPDLIMVLNAQRQILFGNKPVRDFASVRNCVAFEGMRPGELLDCRNAAQAPSGCGTGEACRNCGAVNAILAGLAGRSVKYECRISTQSAEALDLRVMASPFRWNHSEYVLVVAIDISNEKRREVLERIFFHDLLNTAGSIHGIAELMAIDPAAAAELKTDLYNADESLVNEIKSQRLLLAAENNELQVELRTVHALTLLDSVVQVFRNHKVAAGRNIMIAPDSSDCVIETDVTLLTRVLDNLLKNALEASQANETVRVGVRLVPKGCLFWCHNAASMTREVQLQIFQRSFSTKGKGRGVGTYSVKLLTERYLKGKVSFTSTPAEGTCFELFLPRA